MWTEYKDQVIGVWQDKKGWWLVAIEWYQGDKLNGYYFDTKEEAIAKGKEVIDSL